MADQCIVCLEDLDKNFTEIHSINSDLLAETAQVTGLSLDASLGNAEQQQLIAVIQTCGHILHNVCLQAWIEKANSCPICRQTFNLVEVYDKVGGRLSNSPVLQQTINVYLRINC
jgi:4-hydroxy-3-methylbut-2-en-1-yl diphosphate synthase IspG/GcpE